MHERLVKVKNMPQRRCGNFPTLLRRQKRPSGHQLFLAWVDDEIQPFQRPCAQKPKVPFFREYHLVHGKMFARFPYLWLDGSVRWSAWIRFWPRQMKYAGTPASTIIKPGHDVAVL